MQKQTVQDVLNNTFAVHPQFPIVYCRSDGTLKERVALHDMVHLLILDREWPVTFKFSDEFDAALVQAVLRRDIEVSYKTTLPRLQKPLPSISMPPILEETLPKIPSVIKKILNDLGKDVPSNFPVVDPARMRLLFHAAKIFEAQFTEKYHQHFHMMSVQDILGMEFAELKEMFQKSLNAAKFIVSGGIKENSRQF